MRKWQLFSVVGLGLIGLNSPVLASDTVATGSCATFMQQGDTDPATATSDLSTLKVCMADCDQLSSFEAISACRKSLNNLYYASVAQTIESDLNEKTAQNNAAQDNALSNATLLAHIKAMQQQQQQQQQNTAPEQPAPEQTAPANNDAAADTSTSSATNPATPVGPPDDVRW